MGIMQATRSFHYCPLDRLEPEKADKVIFIYRIYSWPEPPFKLFDFQS